MGITESFSTEAYLETGQQATTFSKSEFLSLLGEIGLTVVSEQCREPDSWLYLLEGTDGQAGEGTFAPKRGVFVGMNGLKGSDLFKIEDWILKSSDGRVWYWTSNGNEAFRVEAETFHGLLAEARHGGVGHPHGTPWDAGNNE